MFRPQYIFRIIFVCIAVCITSSFTVEQQHNASFKKNQNNYGLIGEWIQRDATENSIVFTSDNAVTEKSNGKTFKSTWSIKKQSREICIVGSDCVYFECTEIALFLYKKDGVVQYYRKSSK